VPNSQTEKSNESKARSFAESAKREKAFVESQQKLKEFESQLNTTKAEAEQYKARIAELDRVKEATLNGDVDALLTALGIDDEKLPKFTESVTKRALRANDLPPELIELRRQVASLQSEREAERKQLQAEQERIKQEGAKMQEEQQAQVAERWLMTDVVKRINEGQEYDMLKFYVSGENKNSAMALVAEQFAKNMSGENKDIDTALKLALDSVESAILDQEKAHLARVSTIEKLKSKPEAEKEEQLGLTERRQAALKPFTSPIAEPEAPRTLTNQVQSAPPRDDDPNADYDTRFARALKLLV